MKTNCGAADAVPYCGLVLWATSLYSKFVSITCCVFQPMHRFQMQGNFAVKETS